MHPGGLPQGQSGSPVATICTAEMPLGMPITVVVWIRLPRLQMYFLHVQSPSSFCALLASPRATPDMSDIRCLANCPPNIYLVPSSSSLQQSLSALPATFKSPDTWSDPLVRRRPNPGHGLQKNETGVLSNNQCMARPFSCAVTG
jgi:hypothetical protein